MKNIHFDWRKAILSCAGLVLFAIAPTTLVAQTWKKQEQMLVPIVAEGTACNGTSETIGLTSDRSKLLTCQSGVWKGPSTSSPFSMAGLVGKQTVIMNVPNFAYDAFTVDSWGGVYGRNKATGSWTFYCSAVPGPYCAGYDGPYALHTMFSAAGVLISGYTVYTYLFPWQ